MKVYVVSITNQGDPDPAITVYTDRENAISKIRKVVESTFCDLDKGGDVLCFYDGCPSDQEDQIIELLDDLVAGYDVSCDFGGWDCPLGMVVLRTFEV